MTSVSFLHCITSCVQYDDGLSKVRVLRCRIVRGTNVIVALWPLRAHFCFNRFCFGAPNKVFFEKSNFLNLEKLEIIIELVLTYLKVVEYDGSQNILICFKIGNKNSV